MRLRRLGRHLFELFFCFFICNSSIAFAALAGKSSSDLASDFQRVVSPRLQLSSDAVHLYAQAIDDVLRNSNIQIDLPEYLILVDRNPYAQSAMIFWGSVNMGWSLIGASPASTGLPGSFDHFLTPLGVFTHSLDNPDFRAEGTKNEHGFLGYGAKGMRVYDFGWVEQARGWGSGEKMLMRLQMHATDPELAEHLLGIPRSKGCIRIPASMNHFIDHYGLLDADYDLAIEKGAHFWVLRQDREPTDSSGHYLIVIDSGFSKRPSWYALPSARKGNH